MSKKTSIFLQNNLNTRTTESGLRFNNQECLISEGKIGQKIVYNEILELRNIDVHLPRIERYSENSGDVNWSLIFSRVYKVCLEVKLIEFQYCFLRDILINIFWLNTWKLREDWLCTFCNEEIEDLGHLFCERHWGPLAYPKVHCSEGPLFRRSVVPKVHCSEGSLLRRFVTPKLRCIVPKTRFNIPKQE